MCLLPAGPGSLAARPAKQAGKCVYKLFKLWINFSGVCVCVSPRVVIFQKSGLLEIFSLKLERNLNSLRAGGSRGGAARGCRGSAGFPAHGRGAQLRSRAAGGKGRWLVSDRASPGAAVDKRASAGPPCPSPSPPAGTGARRGSRIVLPGSPGDEGIPTPPKGARGDAEPRRSEAEEGCPGRGWARSNEDSSVTRGVFFLSRWSGRSCGGCGAAPRLLPACPTAPLRAWKGDRAGDAPRGWRGHRAPQGPASLRDGGSSPTPHLRLRSGSP